MENPPHPKSVRYSGVRIRLEIRFYVCDGAARTLRSSHPTVRQKQWSQQTLDLGLRCVHQALR